MDDGRAAVLEVVPPLDMDPIEVRLKLDLMLHELEQNKVAEMRRAGRKVVGELTIINQDPCDSPTSWEKRRGRNPKFAGGDRWLRAEQAQRPRTPSARPRLWQWDGRGMCGRLAVVPFRGGGGLLAMSGVLAWGLGCTFDSRGSGMSSAAGESTATSDGSDGSTAASGTTPGSTATETTEPTSDATTDPTSDATTDPGDATTEPTSDATTDAGSDTATGTGTGVGPDEVLDDDDLLVRYYLDEAAAGQAPSQALDAAPAPLHLGHTWAPGIAYIENAEGNRGLRWDQPGNDGGPSIPILGTKVRAALEGQTTLTIEAVVDMQEGMGELSSRIVIVGEGGADARLGLFVSRDPQRPYFRWRGDTDAAVWSPDFQQIGRAVFHVVLQTTAPVEDRLRLYVDGERVDVADDTGWPNDGDPITFTDASTLVLGNRAPDVGGRSFQGVLYYAALYAAAFDEPRIEHHTAVLLEDDDTPAER